MLHLRDFLRGSDLDGIAPDEPMWVIGDIHGRLDLLDALLARLDTETRLVFVGDYLDRGPQSAQVIDRLIGLQFQERAICLTGNHEAMFLGFIDAPERGGGWLRAGGVATLASYGVHGVSEWAGLEQRLEAHLALMQMLPLDHLAFLTSLKSAYLSGNVLASHAGADPSLPLAEQSWEDLVWGHGDFGKMRRSDGVWVAHGHTVCRAATVADGRISVDTGAWASGRLSAARIDPGKVRFVHT
jgi:Calcineurin-like phosphoesterase